MILSFYFKHQSIYSEDIHIKYMCTTTMNRFLYILCGQCILIWINIKNLYYEILLDQANNNRWIAKGRKTFDKNLYIFRKKLSLRSHVHYPTLKFSRKLLKISSRFWVTQTNFQNIILLNPWHHKCLHAKCTIVDKALRWFWVRSI